MDSLPPPQPAKKRRRESTCFLQWLPIQQHKEDVPSREDTCPCRRFLNIGDFCYWGRYPMNLINTQHLGVHWQTCLALPFFICSFGFPVSLFHSNRPFDLKVPKGEVQVQVQTGQLIFSLAAGLTSAWLCFGNVDFVFILRATM